MIFAGTPNMLVRLRTPVGRIKFFRFDEKGQFTTDNKKLIKRVSQRYEIVPTTIEEPIVKIAEVINPVTRSKLRHRKKAAK